MFFLVKSVRNLIFLNLLLFPALLLAGEIRLSYDARTGDKELDVSLGNLNVEAKGDINNFVNTVSVTYDVPEKEVRQLLDQALEPADIYMCYLVGEVADKEVDEVVREFKKNGDKGWGVVARNLGIKPGSKEFHALKKGDFSILKDGGSSEKGKGKGKNKGNNGNGKR